MIHLKVLACASVSSSFFYLNYDGSEKQDMLLKLRSPVKVAQWLSCTVVEHEVTCSIAGCHMPVVKELENTRVLMFSRTVKDPRVLKNNRELHS